MIKSDNKEVVNTLKESIRYRNKHKKFIEDFMLAIKRYFIDKYDFHVRVLTGITWFAVEKDLNYYFGGCEIFHTDFKFTAKVLADFCEEFDCEFEYTTCDGDRYIFTFDDVDMTNALIIG